jgi:hypothetical protein
VVGTDDDNKRTLAREPMLEKLVRAGAAVAESLRSNPNMHQEHAALLAGISRRSHFEYLAGTDEAHLAYQSLVLPALHEQADKAREKAEQDIACVEAGSGAWASWHRWLLEKRYRKIYGDLAQEVKLELTGKDGGPIQTLAVDKLSDAELDAKIAAAAKLGGDSE